MQKSSVEVLVRRTNGTKNSRMIYELEQPNNMTLTIDCRFPEALAVIEGNNPGRVFVDDLNAPRAAGVYYEAGEAEDPDAARGS